MSVPNARTLITQAQSLLTQALAELTPTKSILTAANFQYAGCFKLPQGLNLGYSTGALTARRVGSNLQFLLTGANAESSGSPGDLVHEFSYPGVGPYEAMPTATLIRSWGDIYQGKRLIANSNVTTIRGLKWLNGQLWWAYGDAYNVAGNHDPSLGTSVLNADGSVQAFGPWRTAEHSQKTRGYMVVDPDGKIGIGAPTTSGNANSPWGAMISSIILPPNSTPADLPTNQHVSVPCLRLLYHDINSKQERNTNFKYCDWNVPYDYSQGGHLTNGGPEFTGVDQISAAAWIDLPTKHGIVFFGQLAMTIEGYSYGGGDTVCHQWYGLTTCPHGQDAEPMSIGTGDACGTSVPHVWIYDPEDFARAAQGTLDPTALVPTVLPVSQISTIQGKAYAMYVFGGAHFDIETSTLFVSMIKADCTNTHEPQPIILAWTIQ